MILRSRARTDFKIDPAVLLPHFCLFGRKEAIVCILNIWLSACLSVLYQGVILQTYIWSWKWHKLHRLPFRARQLWAIVSYLILFYHASLNSSGLSSTAFPYRKPAGEKGRFLSWVLDVSIYTPVSVRYFRQVSSICLDWSIVCLPETRFRKLFIYNSFQSPTS